MFLTLLQDSKKQPDVAPGAGWAPQSPPTPEPAAGPGEGAGLPPSSAEPLRPAAAPRPPEPPPPGGGRRSSRVSGCQRLIRYVTRNCFLTFRPYRMHRFFFFLVLMTSDVPVVPSVFLASQSGTRARRPPRPPRSRSFLPFLFKSPLALSLIRRLPRGTCQFSSRCRLSAQAPSTPLYFFFTLLF